MLRRVIQDERRHCAVYRAQAKARLEIAPPRARKLVRWGGRNLLGSGRRRDQIAGGSRCARHIPVLRRRGTRAASLDRPVGVGAAGLEALTLLENVLDAAVARRDREAAICGDGAGSAAVRRCKPGRRPCWARLSGASLVPPDARFAGCIIGRRAAIVQGTRTPPSHGGNRGSNPRGGTARRAATAFLAHCGSRAAASRSRLASSGRQAGVSRSPAAPVRTVLMEPISLM